MARHSSERQGNTLKVRKGATMRQAPAGLIICSQCNASNESEAKLRDHQRISHRGAGIPQELQAPKDMRKPEDRQI